MNKDKKAVLDRVRQRITPEQRELVRMNLRIACQIGVLLKKKSLTQKDEGVQKVSIVVILI